MKFKFKQAPDTRISWGSRVLPARLWIDWFGLSISMLFNLIIGFRRVPRKMRHHKLWFINCKSTLKVSYFSSSNFFFREFYAYKHRATALSIEMNWVWIPESALDDSTMPANRRMPLIWRLKVQVCSLRNTSRSELLPAKFLFWTSKSTPVVQSNSENFW